MNLTMEEEDELFRSYEVRPGCSKRRKTGMGLDSQNPFLNELIIGTIVKMLDIDTLKEIRLLCKLWNRLARVELQRKSLISFTIPTDLLYEHWTTTYVLDPKKTHFEFYLKCFAKRNLPLQKEELDESLMFQHFQFKNYRACDRVYPHDEILNTLSSSFFCNFVRGLSFVDDCVDYKRGQWDYRLWYPDWNLKIEPFANLKVLELKGRMLIRPIVHNFLQKLCTMLQLSSRPCLIETLVISPGNYLEFSLTLEGHTSYKKYLQQLLSHLPYLRNFTLNSHLNPGEVSNLLGKAPNLISLRLRKSPVLASNVLLLPFTSNTIFPVSLPKLEHLELPNVYFDDWNELITGIPSLRSLKLRYQPQMLCAEVSVISFADEEGEYRDCDLECAGLGLEYVSAFIDNLKRHEGLTSFEWEVDSLAEQALRGSHISFSDVIELTLVGVSVAFPNLRKLTTTVSHAKDLKWIWTKLTGLKELTLAPGSSYATRDEDLLGRDGHCGIRAMRNLCTVRLLNDNQWLTSKCFEGFLALPPLNLEIRRAPNICNDLSPELKNRLNASFVKIIIDSE